MNIAIISHDGKKEEMISFVQKYKSFFSDHNIYTTKTTGTLIEKRVGIPVNKFLSGPLGGDQQIGAKVATGEIDFMIFFKDSLTAQPHQSDIAALLRLCDVHDIPAATNYGSAEVFLKAITCR